MATIYATTTASGNNDGTSWEDAYTDLQVALGELQDGDTLLTDTPMDQPFRGGFVVSGRNNLTIRFDQGPNGLTHVTNRIQAAWANEGGGVWSIPLSAEPSGVTYDFRPDDERGTVSGVDLHDPDMLAAIAAYAKRRPLRLSDCRAWYGFLRKAASPTTTPSPGEWSHTGGNLYARPIDAITQSEANTLLCYQPGTPHGIEISQSSDSVLEGEVWATCYPGNGDNGGYGLVGRSCERTIIRDVRAVACGHHSVGFNAAGGDANTLMDCLAVGQRPTGTSQLANPFVHYTDGTSTGHRGVGIAAVFSWQLDQGGRPIHVEALNQTLLSHSSGANTIDVTWSGVGHFDFTDLIEAKHGISLAGAGQVGSAGDAIEPTDETVLGDYSCVAEGVEAVGRSACPGSNLVLSGGTLNRTGDHGGLSGYAVSGTIGSPGRMLMRGMKIVTGGGSTWWAAASDDGLMILEDCTIVVDGEQTAVFRTGATTPGKLILRNTTWSRTPNAGCLCIMQAGSPTIYNNGFPGFASDGRNIIDTSFSRLIRHNGNGADRDAAYWQGLSGASSDRFYDDVLPDLIEIDANNSAASVTTFDAFGDPIQTFGAFG